MKISKRFYCVITVILLFISAELYSQSFLEKLKNKVEEKVEQKIEQKTEEEIDESINGKQDEEPVRNEAPAKNEEKAPKQSEIKSPELQSYSKFDFIPGENLLLFEDFSSDKIGDFPAKWNTDGTGEVVTLNNFPGNWLKMLSAIYIPDQKFTFPKNFTLEFDLIMNAPNSYYCFFFDLMQSIKDERINAAVPGKGGIEMGLNLNSLRAFNWTDGSYGDVDSYSTVKDLSEKNNQKIHIAVWVQDRRLRVYIDNVKTCDIQRILNPELILDRIRFNLSGCDAETTSNFITNLRVAEAGKDDRNKLITEGKLVVYGINFDVSSDKIKPESFPVIKQIADVLKANPNVKIQIVGHTDSDGKAESNLTLSQKRSLAVKNFLVQNFGIDGTKITTDGKGASVPIAPNDTPENKSKNRRVEFIKM